MVRTLFFLMFVVACSTGESDDTSVIPVVGPAPVVESVENIGMACVGDDLDDNHDTHHNSHDHHVDQYIDHKDD